MRRRSATARAITTLVALALLAGCGSEAGSGGEGSSVGSYDPGDVDPVLMYCAYGAVSPAQLQGCVTHVTLDDITGGTDAEGLTPFKPNPTNAERFAFDAPFGKGKCRSDAGPLCRYVRHHPGKSRTEIAQHYKGVQNTGQSNPYSRSFDVPNQGGSNPYSRSFGD
jgi:hypothetical protein